MRVSPKGAKIFGPVPAPVYVVGALLLFAQVIVAFSLNSAEPEPRPPGLTFVVPETPPTPIVSYVPAEVPTPQPPSPTPAMAVQRIPEGKVVRLRRFPGRGSPVIGEVKDKKAKLVFPELGAPWGRSKPLDDGPFVDGSYSRRQTFVTERYGPDQDREWWADVDSQPYSAEPAPGQSLYGVAAATLDYKQSRNFPSRTAGVDLASQPIKNGWVIVREMRMPPSDAGRKARIEMAAVVVVDTGAARPGVLWITIPDTHAHLWPDINRLIGSVRALRP